MVMLAAQFVLAASMAMPLPAQTVSETMAAHAQAAHLAEERGDFPTAVHEYESLTRLLPRSAEMQSNLGVALYFNHEWDRAIAVLGKASALNANLLAPHLFTGLAWYQLSKPDRAVPELETAVRMGASDVIAHTWLGYGYMAQSKYNAAATQFQEACRLAPENIDAWYAQGEAYLQVGKASTLELLQAAPNGGRVWQLAGEQQRLQGNQAKALEDFEQANIRRPDIAELRAAVMELGGTPTATVTNQASEASKEDALYAQAHDAEQKSRSAFEHVLSIAPDSYRAHQILADAFVLEQQEDKAIGEFRAVVHLKPDLPGIHQAIGSSLLRSGKSAEALVEFEAELQAQPYSASVNTLLGQTLLLMGKNDEAEKALRSALLMDRPPPDAYRLLGKLDLHRNDYRAAVIDLTHYLSVNRKDPVPYYLLSRAYRGLGDKARMNDALSQFARVSQDVKARNRAQGELQRFENPKPMDDDVGENTPPV